MGSTFGFFDIDGFVADDRHRVHHAEKKTPEGWTAYFGAMGQDPVHPEGRARIEWWEREIKAPWAWLTTRRDDTRWMTRGWLNEKQLGHSSRQLYMRPIWDTRPSASVKFERIEEWAQLYDTVYVHDDDPEVIRLAGTLPNVLAVFCNWQPKPAHMVNEVAA